MEIGCTAKDKDFRVASGSGQDPYKELLCKVVPQHSYAMCPLQWRRGKRRSLIPRVRGGLMVMVEAELYVQPLLIQSFLG
ncbi:hypothetical protein QJS10_CPB17g00623 [Acorus calamus]|uniref:Uncharacterized protein n=1 Tax=Acorus calamus TaxID=4465 RepID=A0AAV9CVZ3_ACOCL|nr:hypothetical protein QJS10_CPB17g00623 [Acorus calamus]